MNVHDPSKQQRQEILETVLQTIERRFYDPLLNGVNLRVLATIRQENILNAADFISEMVSLVAETKSQPTDFFHESERNVPLGKLVRSTFYKTDADGHCWIFQDVLSDGPAQKAGVEPGALLISANDEVYTSISPVASVSRPISVRFQNPFSSASTFTANPLLSGRGKSYKNLYITHSKPDPAVAYMRISAFPGILGVEIAKDTDRAIKSFKRTNRLIIDLRGNSGSAGAGNLRLMSYLVPGKVPVGYSLTRRRVEAGYKREDLIRFERIPSNKLVAPLTLWKFRKVDKSIVVVTEGLGVQPFHGKTVILVNEHTVSGAEIVAGFAAENKLAMIVGNRTAGRLLAWASLSVGYGYFVTIPIGNYLTWEGKSFEGSGVAPDIEVPFSAEAAFERRDNQLEKAIEVAKCL